MYLVLALWLVTPLSTSAQDAKTGRLSGVVKDTQGAVIPAAAVVVADQQTKAEFKVVADRAGAWTLARVPAGAYTVTVSAPSTVSGVIKDVAVAAGADAKADVTLQVGISESVIVTASKVEQLLVNAPAAVTIVNDRTIQAMATQNYADLMRSVPGVNVAQMSARDFNVTPRQATNIPAGSQLVMIDGRSVNQDYFGYVAWDFLPTNLNEIKQIEVLRGAASAVWGSNAMNGVVNILTKSPREMLGTTVTVGAGTFDRKGGVAESNSGSLFYVNATHAMAINERWAVKGSAGYFTTDAFARPSGTIPNQYNTPYPAFQNFGTKQPKVDVRLDYDSPDGVQHLSFAGGYAGTGGTFHTGLGPFHLENGAYGSYFKADYRRGGLTIRSFLNLWGGRAPSLMAVGPLGAPILNLFDDKSWDIAAENIQVVGGRHLLTYGGNFRHNWTDMTMAPNAKKRDTVGAYFQDEITISEQFRWNVGARLDKFDVLDHAVVSPRTALLFSPMPGSTFRVSYSRAYRAPSLFQNYMDTVVVNRMNLGMLVPAMAGSYFYFPVQGLGSMTLKEQTLDGYEVGYNGSLAKGRIHFGVTYYLTDSRHDMILSQATSYSSANMPAGWPLPGYVLDALIAGNAFGPGMGLPSSLRYQNLGEVRNKGFETSLDAQASRHVSVYANYSWQDQPVPKDFPLSKINLPPTHRFNAGLAFDYQRIQGDLSLGYTSKAFFRDVLDATYAGWTKAFTIINAGLGFRIAGDNLMVVAKVRNLGNQAVQNHLFGDLLKRQIVAELRIRR
jgi:outer membrane receptor for ferrienterochelin and colicin